MVAIKTSGQIAPVVVPSIFYRDHSRLRLPPIVC